jgi:hypothetical protein
MNRALTVVAVLTACSSAVVAVLAACSSARTPAAPAPTPARAEQATAAPATVAPAPLAEQPEPPQQQQQIPAWRVSLLHAEHLETLSHPAFDVRGGRPVIEAAIERTAAELAARIAALPDDSPDLPEAVCRLATKHSRDRGQLEVQLVRAIAAARGRANGQAAQLHGSLRRSYLAVQPGHEVQDGKLVQVLHDRTLSGAALEDCTTPDAGTLRVLLVGLYSDEERYPEDPFTGEPHPGTPTTKKSRPGSALAELDALYREITAATTDDPAVATLVELAAAVYCEPGARASVCAARLASSARAIAIRERALAADDPLLADTRILHAHLITARRPREAEAVYRRVLAQAAPGADARLHAAFDLNALLRARGDRAGALALEASFMADLERPAGNTWTRATLAERWAEVASAEGRAADAARILAAAIRGLAHPRPSCPDFDGCDNRQFLMALLRQQAELDPDAAAALLQAAADHERVLGEQRAQRAAAVARMVSGQP